MQGAACSRSDGACIHAGRLTLRSFLPPLVSAALHAPLSSTTPPPPHHQAIKGIYGGVHALIEIPLASFLVILGIDVRNERSSGMAKRGTDPRPPNDLAASSANSNVGLVTDVETGRVVSIDTSTNTPVAGGRECAA